MKTSCSRLVHCPSNNPQNLGIQNETAIGVIPDPFPHPKHRKKRSGHETIFVKGEHHTRTFSCELENFANSRTFSFADYSRYTVYSLLIVQYSQIMLFFGLKCPQFNLLTVFFKNFLRGAYPQTPLD